MQETFFILMTIVLLLALSETAWLAYIRGMRTVSASRVFQDSLICLLPLVIVGLSTAALSYESASISYPGTEQLWAHLA